mmetsp:Transcript_26609/g.49969  ORF Transcript_26609/g.49969 Transcript_26609/m.49969 type:complete len:204 (+) Transcript_26609:31-642(+)
MEKQLEAKSLKRTLEATLVRAAGLQLQGRQLRLRAERAEAAKAVAEAENQQLRQEVRKLQKQAGMCAAWPVHCSLGCEGLSKAHKPVPVSPAAMLKQIPLPSRRVDPGLPGPGEDGFQPQWTGDYVEAVQKQADLDPDTIFGRVPHCDSCELFPERLFSEAGMSPRKRFRTTQELKPLLEEIQEYKRRMGQTKSWVDVVGNGL